MLNFIHLHLLVLVPFFVGCSFKGTKDADEGYAKILFSKIPSKWFDQQRFALLEMEGTTAPHLFFDAPAGINRAKRLVNYVVVNEEGDATQKNLDFSSGQIYGERVLCSKGASAKGRYPYAEGFVPQTLDQQNLPQKIAVFGRGDEQKKLGSRHFFEAKVIGAFIEQECPEESCAAVGSWRSRLVLVGVPASGSSFSSIDSMDELKKKVKWKEVEEFVAKARGFNPAGAKRYPAYRMGAGASAKQAMDLLGKSAYVFTPKEMEGMKTSCHKLYDYLWKNATEPPKETNFARQFYRDFLKFHQRYLTCSKYVYPASINHDPDRMWYFSFLSGYHRLVDTGRYFNCNRNEWAPQSLAEAGARQEFLKRHFRQCAQSDIELAMEQIPRAFLRLRDTGKPSARFIAYDSGPAGSRMKLYSWVERDNRVLDCSDPAVDRREEIFPKDVEWKSISSSLFSKEKK